jgi:(p)ppGpp synthase/HD superfamily hydrolase
MWAHNSIQGSTNNGGLQLSDLELIIRALDFATIKHQGQSRDGPRRVPFIVHPVTVALLMAMSGGSVIEVCASLLHDVKEDCGVTDGEIMELYQDVPETGRRILLIVNQHTDPPGMRMEQSKAREIEMMRTGQYSLETRRVIIADQTANMIDLVRNPPNWGSGWERRYIVLMEELVDAGRGTSPELEALFDEAAARARKYYQMPLASA